MQEEKSAVSTSTHPQETESPITEAKGGRNQPARLYAFPSRIEGFVGPVELLNSFGRVFYPTWRRLLHIGIKAEWQKSRLGWLQ